MTPGELRELFKDSGFTELVWKDVSSISLEWFEALLAGMAGRPKDAPPPLGLNLLMGKTTGEKAKNLARNLEEDRVRVVMGVLQ